MLLQLAARLLLAQDVDLALGGIVAADEKATSSRVPRKFHESSVGHSNVI